MINVQPLTSVGKDDRGATFVFNNDRLGQFILIHRTTGSISGSEYHNGTDPYKQPEQILIASGSALVEWADMDSDLFGETTVQAPAMVQIPARVWHRVTALAPLVILEQNSIAIAAADSVKIFEHPNKRKEIA